MEKRQQVKTIKVNKVCNECAMGIMLITDAQLLLSNPQQYEYKCNRCDFKETLTGVWPRMEYVDEDPDNTIINFMRKWLS